MRTLKQRAYGSNPPIFFAADSSKTSPVGQCTGSSVRPEMALKAGIQRLMNQKCKDKAQVLHPEILETSLVAEVHLAELVRSSVDP